MGGISEKFGYVCGPLAGSPSLLGEGEPSHHAGVDHQGNAGNVTCLGRRQKQSGGGNIGRNADAAALAGAAGRAVPIRSAADVRINCNGPARPCPKRFTELSITPFVLPTRPRHTNQSHRLEVCCDCGSFQCESQLLSRLRLLERRSFYSPVP